MELKKKMPDERKIKIWPSDNVSYESVLKVVEVVKYSYEKEKKEMWCERTHNYSVVRMSASSI